MMPCTVGADSASWQQSIFRAVLSWACHWAWPISVSFLSWVRTESYCKATWCLCDLLQQSAWRQIIFVFILFIFPRKLLRHISECHGFDCENKNNSNSTVNFVLVLAMRAENVIVHKVLLVQTPTEQCSQQHEQKFENFHKCWNIKEFFSWIATCNMWWLNWEEFIGWVCNQMRCSSLFVLGYTIKSTVEI